jgi:hypothetical protein
MGLEQISALTVQAREPRGWYHRKRDKSEQCVSKPLQYSFVLGLSRKKHSSGMSVLHHALEPGSPMVAFVALWLFCPHSAAGARVIKQQAKALQLRWRVMVGSWRKNGEQVEPHAAH